MMELMFNLNLYERGNLGQLGCCSSALWRC